MVFPAEGSASRRPPTWWGAGPPAQGASDATLAQLGRLLVSMRGMPLNYPTIALQLTHQPCCLEGFPDRQPGRLQRLRCPGVTRIEQTVLPLGKIKQAVLMPVTRAERHGLACLIPFVRR